MPESNFFKPLIALSLFSFMLMSCDKSNNPTIRLKYKPISGTVTVPSNTFETTSTALDSTKTANH